jgi:hypothetical protein
MTPNTAPKSRWCDAVLHRLHGNKATVTVNARTFKTDACKVWLKKGKKKRHYVVAERLPRARAHRWRAPVRVVGVHYSPYTVHGNFTMMAMMNKYADGVLMFNDNHDCFLLADPSSPRFDDPRTHPVGGGNASIRPAQRTGDAIGMPTGPYASLNFSWPDTCNVEKPARHFIVQAFHRIIDLFLKRPDKTTLYYSADPNDSRRLGLGIFANFVGEDVITFISDNLKDVPRMVEYKRKTGKYPPIPMTNP